MPCGSKGKGGKRGGKKGGRKLKPGEAALVQVIDRKIDEHGLRWYLNQPAGNPKVGLGALIGKS